MSAPTTGAYEAGVVDPGLPVANMTQPFWLTEPSKYHNLRSEWTNTADVVIIGSGMTAASLSRTLLSKKPGTKILIVEARSLCSGATGRNGGHIKAMSPGIWFSRKANDGAEEAVRIMEYEHSHIERMTSVIRENGIECDLRELEGLDAYYDAKTFARAVAAVNDMTKYSPRLGAKYKVYTSRKDLRQRQCADEVVGAIGMAAATMWPYKMVTGLIERLVDNQGLLVQTGTPVTRIVEASSNSAATIFTERGSIQAKHIVHATNGWLGHLIPELRPYISPVRANVQRQMPSSTHHRLQSSFWLRYSEGNYDYMMQRPDGAIVIGRCNLGRRATADDSEVDFLPHAHLSGVAPLVHNYGTKELRTTHRWSGPVAFTQDGNPFVGRLPFEGRSHQWVCGGFQGIGMVRAFRAAEMLASMLVEEEVSPEHPSSMVLSDKRWQRLQQTISPAAKL